MLATEFFTSAFTTINKRANYLTMPLGTNTIIAPSLFCLYFFFTKFRYEYDVCLECLIFKIENAKVSITGGWKNII